MDRIDKNISDFKKDTLAIDQFLTGTRISYEFFKDEYPRISKEFGDKERDTEEIEGMNILSNLNDNLPTYEKNIFTFCFINLIARMEAFLNDVLESVYQEIGKDLSEDQMKKSILKFSHSSFKEKIKFLKTKFNLIFPEIEGHFANLIELFSTRNLILHNNGIVNETYLRINNESEFELGDKRVITEEYLKLSIVLLILVAKSIEKGIKTETVANKT